MQEKQMIVVFDTRIIYKHYEMQRKSEKPLQRNRRFFL